MTFHKCLKQFLILSKALKPTQVVENSSFHLVTIVEAVT